MENIQRIFLAEGEDGYTVLEDWEELELGSAGGIAFQ